MAARRLIVNADDFGQSPGINEGIIEAHERGIVTSASLMVRWPAAPAAAAYARSRPELSVGLHVDLGEMVYKEDTWVALYQVVSIDDADAVAREVQRQLDAFIRLLGRPPSHLDSHQHVHRDEPIRSILLEYVRTLGVPLRHFSPDIAYRGDFYGQTAKGDPYPAAIGVDSLLAIVRGLPEGMTELGCHPGLGSDIRSMYVSERALEVQSLCDPRVRAAIGAEHINLQSFHASTPAIPSRPPAS